MEFETLLFGNLLPGVPIPWEREVPRRRGLFNMLSYEAR